MKKIQLGAQGPLVTTVGFGAWGISGKDWGDTDDDVSKKALHQALDLGMNFIDTADVYGLGHSEELVASVLSERGGKEDVIIATKGGSDFYHSSQHEGHIETRNNMDKKYLVWAAEQSLKRLKVDSLDIFQLHSPGRAGLERDEPWEALRALKEQGKIRCSGWSVQSFQETEQADFLDRYHETLDTIQVRYNLLDRRAEKVLFPKAREYGIGVIVRIPLLFGVLTGKFDRSTRFPEDDHRHINLAPEKLSAYLSQMEKMQTLYDRYPDQSAAQISLRFCLSHPATHMVIPGAKTPQQAKENCAVSDLGPLPAEVIPPLPDPDQKS